MASDKNPELAVLPLGCAAFFLMPFLLPLSVLAVLFLMWEFFENKSPIHKDRK